MSAATPDQQGTAGAAPEAGALTEAEFLRYSRHLQLPGFGLQAQTELKQSRVLVVGAGGLGAPVLQYIAAAGVGRITIVDGDAVELSNLQRQVLFDTAQIGDNKAQAAAARIRGLNPAVKVSTRPVYLDGDNARDLIDECDLVIDCTDNLPTRYLINECCVQLLKPWIFASIYHFAGQLSLFEGKQGPCFRCLFPEAAGAPDCNEAGVLGVLPGLLGMFQANEAIKYLAGIGDSIAGQLLTVDALSLTWKSFTLTVDPDCPDCGTRPNFPPELPAEEPVCIYGPDPERAGGSMEPDGEEPTHQEEYFDEEVVNEISPAQLKKLLAHHPELVMIDLREPELHRAFNLGGENIGADELASRVNDLDPDAETLLYCQFGKRSLGAAHFLLQSGFTRVGSLTGGVEDYLKARINGGDD